MKSNKKPWQLEMFRRSLKKQQKLSALIALIDDCRGRDCLLVTCGDNNGAMNWHFRELGGLWSWADVSAENTAQISALLNEPVEQAQPDSLPYDDERFDVVVAIDVLEHLEQDQPFLQELRRVLRAQGQALVTVPNGDSRLLANRIKWRVGMTPAVYGHTRAGYSLPELRQAVEAANLAVVAEGGYSRFFTEMVELVINFGYVFVLSKKQGGVKSGQIAPLSAGEMKTHGLAYRLYGIFFPLIRAVSALDNLLPARSNNAVIVAARKEPC